MENDRRRVLIVGCGYVGQEVARQLTAAGHHVFGLRRTPADPLEANLPYTPCVGDLTRPETLETLPNPLDWVINTVSSSRGGVAEYRSVYYEGTRNLIRRLQRTPLKAFAYTSSTSVYGQKDGSWVDENAPTQPGTETGQLLVDTERLLLEAYAQEQFPARILRVAGIYGPGRGHLFQQWLRGEARLQGDGRRWMNMIHRHDVASALVAVLERGRGGQIYNAVDTEPVTQVDFLGWLAQQTGRPLASTALPGEVVPSKRGITNKRVSSAKLQTETGWIPRYPTFREGYLEPLRGGTTRRRDDATREGGENSEGR